MSPLIQLCGSFTGALAEITLDGSVMASSVSNHFLNSHNIPCSVVIRHGVAEYSSHGPVMVPTPSGWFQSSMLFTASPVLPFDVILGADWIAVVCGADK
jgi:hypothetical protein